MRADRRSYIPLKIVIAGGFGVGKTTMVHALSEIPPLVTEEALTTASVGLDDVSAVPGKTTTTVAMDFGRISMDDLVLYLFGTPGQDRFWFMWDELARGSVGAVVLVDLRRVLPSDRSSACSTSSISAAVHDAEARASTRTIGVSARSASASRTSSSGKASAPGNVFTARTNGR